MPIKHKVEQGECILSISCQYGTLWETVWNHPANAQLKQLRKQPTILFPGDIVVIPDKDQKQEGRQTDAMHTFKISRMKAVLRLQLFEEETPRANQQYRLTVDGNVVKGVTDDQGNLEVQIAADAKQGDLVVGPEATRYTLDLGCLDPVTKISGIQARLANMGYYNGDIDGALGDSTRRALMLFQRRYGLDGTGEPDAQTQSKLESQHDTVCPFPADSADADTTSGAP